jgi:hypothetical protein
VRRAGARGRKRKGYNRIVKTTALMMTTLDELRHRNAEIEDLAQRHGAHSVRIFGLVVRGDDAQAPSGAPRSWG